MIGRNERCWCGSGRKFKKCHGSNKIDSMPASMLDVGKARKNLYDTKECLADDKRNCSDKIIKAHTISKSTSLAPIAENGHVLTFTKAVKQTYEEHWVPTRVGINNATTLTCFCSYHDNLIFEEIDKPDFEFNKKNAFILSYRNLIKEYYEKVLSVKLFLLSEKYHRSQDEFRYYSARAAEEAALKSLEERKLVYEEILKKKQFDKFFFKAFPLPETLKLVCAAATFVDVDINGNEIQSLTDLKYAKSYVCINVIYSAGKPYAIFGWDLYADKHMKMLLDSIEQSDDPIKQLIYYIFINVGNICMNETWYSNLSSNTKKTLTDALELGGVGHIPRSDLFPLTGEIDAY